MVLAWMGFMMLSGASSPTRSSAGSQAEVSLTGMKAFFAA